METDMRADPMALDAPTQQQGSGTQTPVPEAAPAAGKDATKGAQQQEGGKSKKKKKGKK
jgi:hypothetical protein